MGDVHPFLERLDTEARGLLLSVALQAMIHAQVVTALAPPKGMPLPFVSHGGTALVVSSLAIGLALGAARRGTEAATVTIAAPASAAEGVPA